MLARSIYKETLAELDLPILSALPPDQRVETCRAVYKKKFNEIREAHNALAGGLSIAKAGAALMDALILTLYEVTLNDHPAAKGKITLVALGGYGRGYLNPHSDVDLLFLTQEPSRKLPAALTDAIEAILYPLWDLGFKVGHSSRNIADCIQEAKQDTRTLTSLLEARLLCGDLKYFEQLTQRFRAQVVRKNKNAYLESRMKDLQRRYERYSGTVFLQEPNVKESPGGLRDYQNILWAANVTRDCFSLKDLVSKKLLTKKEADELTEAIDFLHQIRNELHYQAGKSSDILTLRLQGVLATVSRYPERTILRRTEAFMRDYYLHARSVADRLLSVLEILNIQEKEKPTLLSLLPFRSKKVESVDGFLIKNGLLHATKNDLFQEDSALMMRAFQLCQMRGLDLSPDLRILIKNSWPLIDDRFRHSPSIAETFQSILERKGAVGRILRMMHRVGFLGRWLPEFGAMDCLVQHEFFHRYTADEHTLRCIDQLDALFGEEAPSVRTSENRDLFRSLLLNQDDPYALYLALLLHDSGRAENVREHTDGSAVLASQVCTRLRIVGSRRRLITFLVDQHLTFWRYATTRNIDDLEVIEEFARLIKTQSNLEALYLFTYADSLGTNEESWSSWKDSLMNQLYKNTTRYFRDGDSRTFHKHLDREMGKLKERAVKAITSDEERAAQLRRHLDLLPDRYFRFRKLSSIIAHIETMDRFQTEQKKDPRFPSVILWRDYPDKGYTEFVISARNQPFFIEKLCCALASQQVNILSAEIFTRPDGIILDILRICTVRHEPVTDARTRKRVEAAFADIQSTSEYTPEKYLQKKRNFLTKPQEGIAFPVRAWVRGDISPCVAVVEIQALDRIGLLHDVFRCIGEYGLETLNARIATEKGAALDTIYITQPDGSKPEDAELLHKLEEKLNTLLS